MDHSHHMHPAVSAGVDYLFLLGLVFFAGALFYMFRLSRPNYLRKINGYWDPENEFWHGMCLLSMVTMLSPSLVQLFTPTVWAYMLPIGICWYLIRAFTYGKKIPHNKQWYDFAHAAMLFGMWWMFVEPINNSIFTAIFAGYWTWFAGYYSTRIWADFKKPHWLSIGQNLAHFVMAVVMVLMTVAPVTFMPEHHHDGLTMPNPIICGRS